MSFMKRPAGITVLGVIAVIYGVFNLLLALLGLLGSALKASGVGAGAIKYSAGTLAYATISDAVLGILLLAFGIGALRLKGWAWMTGIAVLALEIVRQIVGLFMQGFSTGTIARDGITIVIALLVLGYLLRPNVRALFGAAA
jgi:hypothetical protein